MQIKKILKIITTVFVFTFMCKINAQSLGGSFGTQKSNGLQLTQVIGQSYGSYFNKKKSSVILSQGQILPTTFSTKPNIGFDIKCFPNPFTSNLKIQSSSGQFFDNVELIDLSGRVVFDIQFGESEFKQIELKHLIPGVYILKVSDGNKDLSTQQIIKSK